MAEDIPRSLISTSSVESLERIGLRHSFRLRSASLWLRPSGFRLRSASYDGTSRPHKTTGQDDPTRRKFRRRGCRVFNHCTPEIIAPELWAAAWEHGHYPIALMGVVSFPFCFQGFLQRTQGEPKEAMNSDSQRLGATQCCRPSVHAGDAEPPERRGCRISDENTVGRG